MKTRSRIMSGVITVLLVGMTVMVISVCQVHAQSVVDIAPLPFWLSYCEDPTCGGKQPLVVHVCPETNASCEPSRQTTVVPRLDERQIDQILLLIQKADGSDPITLTLVSGSGSLIGSAMVLSTTSPVIVKSDVDITLSYYQVTPVWGGTTNLDFVSATKTSPEVETIVYRHPTFLVNDEVIQLHERSRNIIAVESQIAGIHPGQMHAFFMPTEFVTIGEGNFSDGNLNVWVNYGNPPYIDVIGSVYDTALPRFAHEYVHEMFSEVSQSHPGGSLCLNEGIADAFAFAAGFLPENDFGPVGLHGADFNQGCTEIEQNFEVHDAGNCPFWQIRRLGLLSPSFAARVLDPQRIISFDSCDLTSSHTGNALLVLFSEAAGRDMTQAIQMAEIPNAGSYEAAMLALELAPSTVLFSTFTTNVEIETSPKENDLEVKANFTLGTGNNGIYPVHEDVTFELTGGSASFSVTIPAGSFRQYKKGGFKFKGSINNVSLEAQITQFEFGRYAFEFKAEGVNLKGIANPVKVKLTIGNDGGKTPVTAKFEKDHDGQRCKRPPR